MKQIPSVPDGEHSTHPTEIAMSPEQSALAENSANGDSVIYLGIDGKVAGILCISDPLREESAQVIALLKSLGVRQVIMLTGDGEATAKAVAEKLGIDQYRSQVLPEDKAAMVEELKAKGHRVIMVGDGINDSPALAMADVSVSMKGSSDIAREVADITLLTDRLDELVTIRLLATRLMSRIKVNFQVIVSFNTALLLLGLAAALTPNLFGNFAQCLHHGHQCSQHAALPEPQNGRQGGTAMLLRIAKTGELLSAADHIGMKGNRIASDRTLAGHIMI